MGPADLVRRQELGSGATVMRQLNTTGSEIPVINLGPGGNYQYHWPAADSALIDWRLDLFGRIGNFLGLVALVLMSICRTCFFKARPGASPNCDIRRDDQIRLNR